MEDLSLSNMPQNPRTRLLNNILKGKIGEEIAQTDYLTNGYSVIPTGTGSDFIAVKIIDDLEYTEFVEVKTGGSRTSKRQIDTMRKVKKVGDMYTVYRISDEYLDTYLNESSNAKIMTEQSANESQDHRFIASFLCAYSGDTNNAS